MGKRGGLLMFVYEKKLQYPVNIKTPNARLAKAIMSQLGGPDGELGAALRYLNQRFTMPMPELKATLTDIGTEAPPCGKKFCSFSNRSVSLPFSIFACHFSGISFK